MKKSLAQALSLVALTLFTGLGSAYAEPRDYRYGAGMPNAAGPVDPVRGAGVPNAARPGDPVRDVGAPVAHDPTDARKGGKYTGSLRVLKSVVNATGAPAPIPASFSMMVDCTPSGPFHQGVSVAPGSVGTTIANIAAQSYCKVTEPLPSPIAHAEGCKGGSASWATLIAPAQPVPITANAVTTVTVRNTLICDKPKNATLTIRKILVPGNDPGRFNLTIDGSTAGTGADIGNGGSTGTVNVNTGFHTVSESAGTATSLSDYSSVISGDCSPSGAVTLAAGDHKTCLITNTRKATGRSTLTLRKVIVPSSDQGKFNLLIDGSIAGTGANVGHNGNTGPVTVNSGLHSVSETAGTSSNLGNYVTSYSPNCLGGNIYVAPGANEICTITNHKKPMMAVNKVLIPANDPGTFNLLIDGSIAGTGAGVGHNGTTGIVNVTVGSHTVSESAGAGTDLGDYTTFYSQSCKHGNTSLTWGDYKTCTITNTRNPAPPTLTVNKILIPATDPGKFALRIDGIDKSSAVGNNGTTGPVVTSVGLHSVSEVGAGANPADYTAVFGGDCDAAGEVTLATGDHKTCTITNTRNPSHGTWTSPGPGTYYFTVCPNDPTCNINGTSGEYVAITVEAWGAGGGGGGGQPEAGNAGGNGGGGGGGGGYGKTTFNAIVSSSVGINYFVRVGAGGVNGTTAGPFAGRSGGPGGLSEIRHYYSGGTLVLKATGGKGGTVGQGGGGAGFGGAGGSGTINNWSGLVGGTGAVVNTCNGGAGGLGGPGGGPGRTAPGYINDGGNAGHGGYLHSLAFPTCTAKSNNFGLAPGVAGGNGRVKFTW